MGVDADPTLALLPEVDDTDRVDVTSCFPCNGNDNKMCSLLEDSFVFLDWRLILVPDDGDALAL